MIRAPIDGVVIARNVDVGQTVAASLQAPILFVIANDLSRMQVQASIDEADVGRVKAGQEVTFRVDAFPERSVPRAASSRCGCSRRSSRTSSPTTRSSASTTPGSVLMPGMTATVSVVSQEREDVLRVPAAALRFRPEGFEAEAPDAWPGVDGRGRRAEASPGAAPVAAHRPGAAGARRRRQRAAGRAPAAAASRRAEPA